MPRKRMGIRYIMIFIDFICWSLPADIILLFSHV